MAQSKQKSIFFPALITSFVLVDAVALLSKLPSFAGWGGLACHALPHLGVASFVMPSRLLAYAEMDCSRSNPSVGMAVSFFVIKILIAQLFAAGFYVWSLLFDLEETFSRWDAAVKRNHGLMWMLITDAFLPFVTGLYFFMMVQPYIAAPATYPTNALFKLDEDLVCPFLMASFEGLLILPTYSVVFLLGRRPNAK